MDEVIVRREPVVEVTYRAITVTRHQSAVSSVHGRSLSQDPCGLGGAQPASRPEPNYIHAPEAVDTHEQP
jgi:hypothetical protein